MRPKELNNLIKSPEHSNTLPKSLILSGRQNFEHLFSNSSLLTASTVNLRFTVYDDPAKKTRAGFIASKKLGNAVKRNQMKRLLREAFRLHRHLIQPLIAQDLISVHFVLMARNSHSTFEHIQRDVILLLNKLQAQLQPNISPTN